MPTLRLVYLTDQQYAGMTDHAHGAANNTTAENSSINQENQDQTRLVPIADATRNASSKKPPVGEKKKMAEQSDHEEDNDYLDTLLQESIDAINSRSFGGHALRHQQVQQEMLLSSDEENENDSSSSESVHVVDAVQQFQHEMVSSDEESENESEDSSSLEFVDAGVQQIVGEKRRASSASKDMVAAGGTRRSKRAKVAVKAVPAYYVPAEEESLEAWSYASSRIVIRNTTLTTDSPRPLDHSSATDETIEMNVSNRDTNRGSSPRVLDVAAATMVDKRRKVCKTFDERFKDLMAFKAKFGHCNVPQTKSSNDKYLSLGLWCGNIRRSYKTNKEGGMPRNNKLTNADMKRLENAGFEWNLYKTFDERFKDLLAFKAKFGHCNVPQTKSSNNKYTSLGQWCSNIRQSYKAINQGGLLRCKLSKADIKRLEKAGFEWRIK